MDYLSSIKKSTTDKCIFCGYSVDESVCESCKEKLLIFAKDFDDLMYFANEITQSSSLSDIMDISGYLAECIKNIQKKVNKGQVYVYEMNGPLKDAIDKFKRDYLVKTLEKHDGNRTKAAEELDIQRTYLSRLITKYKLDI